MPVYRPAASSILRSFWASGKRHLLLAGGRGSGKTTLLRALMPSLCPDARDVFTTAVPAMGRDDKPPGQRRSLAGLMPPCPR